MKRVEGREGRREEEGRMSEGGGRKELSYVPSGRHNPGVVRPLPPERSQDFSALLSRPAGYGEGQREEGGKGEGGEERVTQLDSLSAFL